MCCVRCGVVLSCGFAMLLYPVSMTLGLPKMIADLGKTMYCVLVHVPY